MLPKCFDIMVALPANLFLLSQNSFRLRCAPHPLLMYCTSILSLFCAMFNGSSCFCTLHFGTQQHCGQLRANIDRSMLPIVFARGTAMGTQARTLTDRYFRLSLHAKPLWAPSCKHYRVDESLIPVASALYTTMGAFAQTSINRCFRILSLHATPLWAP